MTRRANRISAWSARRRDFLVVRPDSEASFWVEAPENQVDLIVDTYPGTVQIEDMQGNVVWRPN